MVVVSDFLGSITIFGFSCGLKIGYGVRTPLGVGGGRFLCLSFCSFLFSVFLGFGWWWRLGSIRT